MNLKNRWMVWVLSSMPLLVAGCSSGSGTSTATGPITPTLTFTSCVAREGTCASTTGTGASASNRMQFDRTATNSIIFTGTPPTGRSLRYIVCSKVDPNNAVTFANPTPTQLQVTINTHCTAGEVTAECSAVESEGGTKTLYLKFVSTPC